MTFRVQQLDGFSVLGLLVELHQPRGATRHEITDHVQQSVARPSEFVFVEVLRVLVPIVKGAIYVLRRVRVVVEIETR